MLRVPAWALYVFPFAERVMHATQRGKMNPLESPYWCLRGHFTCSQRMIVMRIGYMSVRRRFVETKLRCVLTSKLDRRTGGTW